MSARIVRSNQGLDRVVEKQMRNWELARAQRTGPPGTILNPEVEEFVCISRAVGSGGAAVAALLGEKLGWPVFDRQILQTMAHDDQVRAKLYEAMDERDVGWLETALRWLLQVEFRHQEYFHRLTETVLALARQGHGVFLGRGCDLILPVHHGLRVRVTAPEAERVRRFASETSMPVERAEVEVERIERERAEYISHHFPKTPRDAARFDLVVNLARFAIGEAVELILHAMRVRGMIRA